MAQPHEQRPDLAALFADLYEKPNIQRMLDELTDDQFEDFVGYVLRQAGYFVEDTAMQYGQGLDLKLFTGPVTARALHAGVSVKHFSPTNLVTGPHVMHFRGALNNAGIANGYVVTTNTFNGAARTGAQNKPPQIWLMEGGHFLRYITYVRGTRPVGMNDADDEISLLDYSLMPLPPEALFIADGLLRRPMETTRVLAVANHKGGVGKTTTALNLAFGLAAHDKQVLLVDMDTQANLTSVLSSPHAHNAHRTHLGDYFTRRQPLADLIRPTQFPRVWLIPSDTSLALSDTGVAGGPATELRFVRDLHAEAIAPPHVLDARPFDWIILDSGPSMGLFTRAALAASHYVLMPTAPGVFADMGTDLLVTTVATMGALVGKPITILGLLVTHWKDDALNRSLLRDTTVRLEPTGLPLFETKIPLDKNNIEKSHLEAGQGRRRNLIDRRCASALAYLEALEEVLSHVNARW